MDEIENVREKLKALGVHLGGEKIVSKVHETRIAIEDLLPGRKINTPFGEIFLLEEIYPQSYSHGNVKFPDHLNFEVIANWAGIVIPTQLELNQVLFLDTETSGLSHGTGTFAFLIGLGFIKNSEFHLLQLFMEEPSLEPALLAGLARYIDSFEYVVSFNGKSFDIPLLENRHILYKIPSAFEGMQHIDLLHLARKIYRNRLASRRLSDLEAQILQFRRSKEEVPGWLVPELYKEYLRTGDPRPITGVFYHNAIDVITLSGLFIYISHILENPLDNEIENLDLLAIGNLYEELGDFETAIDIYERCLVRDLPIDFYLQTLKRFALMYKKNEDWKMAIPLWEKAASLDQIDACIELAKYFEHQAKNYATAQEWTKKALAILEKFRGTNIEYDISELLHRSQRIEAKGNSRD